MEVRGSFHKDLHTPSPQKSEHSFYIKSCETEAQFILTAFYKNMHENRRSCEELISPHLR